MHDQRRVYHTIGMELTVDQAFAAAYLLIADKHIRKYGKPPSSLEDDVEFVLNAMYLVGERSTNDPAFWHDWWHSIQKVVGEGVRPDAVRLTERDAYLATIQFLERFYIEREGNDVGVGELMYEMREALETGGSTLAEKWSTFVDRASRQPVREIVQYAEWC